MRLQLLISALVLLCGTGIMSGNLVAQNPDIIAIEYYFDTDPGFGNGIPVNVNSGPIIQETFTIDLDTLPDGHHKLYVRVRDSNSNWSFTHFTDFIKIKPPDPPPSMPDVASLEYFIDSDPGFGNGIDIPVTPGQNIEQSFVIDIGPLDVGFHRIYFRVCDSEGNHSFTDLRDIIKIADPDPAPSMPDVTALEYFIDNDPGFGNGTSLPVATGQSVSGSYVIDITSLDDGHHRIFFRAMDSFGRWSTTDVRDIFRIKMPAPPPSLPDMIAAEYYINSDPGFGNGIQIPLDSDTASFAVDVSEFGVGTHNIVFRVMNENGIWSHTGVDQFCVQGLQVLLEGPYDTLNHAMKTILNDNGLLPLEQPFDSDPGAVWYYNGNESVPSIPDANIVDWVLIQARDASTPGTATSATVTEMQPAFLLKNGKVVGLDGESPITLTQPIVNSLFIVIWHRNHLGVMSGYPVDHSGDCQYTFNFTSGPDQAHGGTLGHNELEPGVWGMISGDGDADGQVNNVDKNDVWAIQAGAAGYLAGDFNMDAQANNLDKNELWAPNTGSGGQIPN